ncbi:guanylate kinase family protein [Cyclospora cayetanensis]|uniref:Guanylate kinase family protein n=1 Tax=Cyclospora cayetanensis TaxID=88456 RepID=A0A1D3CRE8_9EIME|nr:guanylate kinase family protein [Cyclospora cayetanensis]
MAENKEEGEAATHGRGEAWVESLFSDDLEKAQRLRNRAAQIQASNTERLCRTRGLRDLLTDFTSAVLLSKPEDVFEFAREYFSAFVETDSPDQPLVNTKPSG